MKTKHSYRTTVGLLLGGLLLLNILPAVASPAGVRPVGDTTLPDIVFQPFIPEGYVLESRSGPGLEQEGQDILLEISAEEEGGGGMLVLVRRDSTGLHKIAGTSRLLPDKQEVGVSGGLYPTLSGEVIYADYHIGSGSAYSEFSIQFTKASDGAYYLSAYTEKNFSYGVEDLFRRKQIRAPKDLRVNFNDVTMQEVFPTAGGSLPPDDAQPRAALQEAYDRVREEVEANVPEGWQLGCWGVGDLNKDANKQDIVMIAFDKESADVILLTQGDAGGYRRTAHNADLLTDCAALRQEGFNPDNFRLVIKDGYFTIETRTPTRPDGIKDGFEHWYITFRYDADSRTFLLHRFDIDQYSGFDTKPLATLQQLSQKDFGSMSFESMSVLPGIYCWELPNAVLEGVLVKQMFYGRPGYGEDPTRDEKLWAYILKTDFPIQVYTAADPMDDPEMMPHSVSGVREVQVYIPLDSVLPALETLENRKVRLEGTLQPRLNAHHHKDVILQLTAVLSQ